jgi:hypothetical protein
MTVVSMITSPPLVDRQLETGDAFLEPNWNPLQNPSTWEKFLCQADNLCGGRHIYFCDPTAG